MTAKRIRTAVAAFFIALGLTAAGTAVASTAHASTTASTPNVYYHT